MRLDFTSLKKAIASLDRAIQRSQTAREDEELRDAVIQRFEYTYELCWKMLKRQLELESPNPALIDTLSFRDLLREAAQVGILKDIESWMDYRQMRNITSHTYDDAKARSVYKAAIEFFDDASALLKALETRDHD
ncbi:nucleotidyltransferase [candidate division LCP-89 bacterium B3_LCP]|uniref:Nucleotidyltransferase n=1 Tax=candidate division LCP-89 bacterium B3_LCP TaxID=2012998 RepID=A0A532USP5_UNCL8|nr:MAG: nucleotidyltransferase [candidate division LCP-89 bacterium B3_LCP]